LRYERKYRIEESSLERVKQEVLANPACFFTSYPDRQVNSIYYDDINYTAYNDNLLGIGERVKYRVRWYGKKFDHINDSILEKKIKKNVLGTKEYIPLRNFNLNDGPPDVNQEPVLSTNQLFPHIIVSYNRCYYESMDKMIRATIDSGLRYFNLVNGKVAHEINSDEAIILEIKYDQGMESMADSCLQALPYRMTKNSKYVSAMKFYLG